MVTIDGKLRMITIKSGSYNRNSYNPFIVTIVIIMNYTYNQQFF